jgi:hypothetical protein
MQDVMALSVHISEHHNAEPSSSSQSSPPLSPLQEPPTQNDQEKAAAMVRDSTPEFREAVVKAVIHAAPDMKEKRALILDAGKSARFHPASKLQVRVCMPHKQDFKPIPLRHLTEPLKNFWTSCATLQCDKTTQGPSTLCACSVR